ncbi:hypothetical protein Tco_0436982 [Tanacetum coccineum]
MREYSGSTVGELLKEVIKRSSSSSLSSPGGGEDLVDGSRFNKYSISLRSVLGSKLSSLLPGGNGSRRASLLANSSRKESLVSTSGELGNESEEKLVLPLKE